MIKFTIKNNQFFYQKNNNILKYSMGNTLIERKNYQF